MIINLEMDSFVLHPQSSRGITDDDDVKKLQQHPPTADDAVLSPSSSDVSSVVSSGDDSDMFEEEVNSPTSDSSSTSSSSGLDSQLASQSSSGPLQDMSSLLLELPIKRGLSRHYDGKSQSFTSLANVTSLEDLAKPENPYNKKLKSCRSYGGLFESHGSTSSIHHKGSSSRLISKKTARGSCSSLCVKRNSSFLGNRPPIPPPHRSASTTNFTSQRPLFALGI